MAALVTFLGKHVAVPLVVLWALIEVTYLKAAPEEEPAGVIQRAVMQAKAEGATSVTLSRYIPFPTPVNSVDAVERDASVIFAEPASATVAAGRNMLTTWYQLRVIETLLRQPTTSPSDFEPPPGVLAAAGSSQLILPVTGGHTAVDGIAIRQAGTQLRIGSKYMLVVYLKTARIAQLAAGDSGIFEVDAERVLHPFDSTRSLALEVRDRWGNNFESVRHFFNTREHLR